MKKIIAVICLTSLASLATDRVCTDLPAASEASIKPYHAELEILSDGGCQFMIRANLNRPDGGILPAEETAFKDISGANRTTCLDIVQVKGLVFFKSEKGF